VASQARARAAPSRPRWHAHEQLCRGLAGTSTSNSTVASQARTRAAAPPWPCGQAHEQQLCRGLASAGTSSSIWGRLPPIRCSSASSSPGWRAWGHVRPHALLGSYLVAGEADDGASWLADAGTCRRQLRMGRHDTARLCLRFAACTGEEATEHEHEEAGAAASAPPRLTMSATGARVMGV
jgi:hypothetical protein